MPYIVHSERIPRFSSILVTLRQVLKSSSTTNVRTPFSSSISIFSGTSSEIWKDRVTTNSVPTPFSLCTSISPFIKSTIFLVIAMPRPVPITALAPLFNSRSKGSKTFFTKSELMPMPLSLTWNSNFAQPAGAP